jgi:hypothetical protein
MTETRLLNRSDLLFAPVGAMPADQPYGQIDIWDGKLGRVPPSLRVSAERRILARQQAQNRAKAAK